MKTQMDVGMLTLGSSKDGVTTAIQAGATGTVLLQSTFSETNAEVSPDNHWVAYQSNESGMNEVHVRPFPNVDAGHVQISNGGGTRPVWSRDGRELFYYSGSTGAIMAVPVPTTGPTFSPGNPVKLFDAGPYYFGVNGRTYDVAKDGQFLMIRLASASGTAPNAPPPNLVVVEHRTEELKTRVGTK